MLKAAESWGKIRECLDGYKMRLTASVVLKTRNRIRVLLPVLSDLERKRAPQVKKLCIASNEREIYHPLRLKISVRM